MKTSSKKRICLFLASILLATSVTACGAKTESQSETAESVMTEETVSEEVTSNVDSTIGLDEEESQEPVEKRDTVETAPADTNSSVEEAALPEESQEDLSTKMAIETTEDVPELSSSINAIEEEPSEEDKETTTAETAPAIVPTTEPESEERPSSVSVTEENSLDELDSIEAGLSDDQRNSINMLNYMTLLTEEINNNKNNQLFLDSAYLSLKNDIFPKVDTKTQGQITSLMDTIYKYRMTDVKRERLNFIYEQSRAQALRQAIPNPVGLLSAVQSGSLLKAVASVLYMAVDSVSSYKAATSKADLQFIKDGWELDDAESAEIHNSTKNALNYMFNMVRDYDLPGDYALSAEAVEDFVTWSSKPDSQLVNKIRWMESHKGTYEVYGPYWLEIAKDYYNSGRYQDCLDAFKEYEAISTRIFRRDIDYATALPMAIIAAKETLNPEDYRKLADNYCSVILRNTKDLNWSLRYFVAQIYIDLYRDTNDDSYIDKAYQVVYDNVNELVNKQKELNAAYLDDVDEVKAEKDDTKRQKEEKKQYNKVIKEERKTALPPVDEALYLNCDLLFSLAEMRDTKLNEKRDIEAMLHENGKNIFLTQALDDRFWFDKRAEAMEATDIDVSFDGKKMTLPATCVTNRSIISATVTGANGTTSIDDWIVTNVKRPKGASCAEFIVYLESQNGKDYKYQAGDKVTIKVIPVSESPDEFIELVYDVTAIKVAFVFKGIKFERVK